MPNDPATVRARLRSLDRVWLGLCPATIATCSPDGIPNVTFLSILHLIDEDQLALSFQFFNKTRANILANPRAQILVPDPATFVQYRIDVEYIRTETSGPIFERMRTHLAAIASQVGMTHVFRLQGSDIYRVQDVEALAHDLELSPSIERTDFMAGLETLSSRLADCDDLETLLDTTLDGLAKLFDYQQSMILLADGAGKRLHMVASRGFAESGVGAEVAFGDGILGTAAHERHSIRIVHMLREHILAEAVRATAREQGQRSAETRDIPLPGVPDALSQIAVPILARDRVLGVLSVQSPQSGRLTIADERTLNTVARHVATSMLLLLANPTPTSDGGAAAQVYTARPTGGDALHIRYHESDDSVFVEDEYLIKGLPGRILYKLLSIYERDGRIDFTNRELRLDSALQLGGYRDNLEARLILLRRRLVERTADLRLERTGRGRLRLILGRPFTITRAS